MTELGYVQSQEQRQVMSQQMIQSAQILQMDVQELETYIQEIALENPLIDLDEMEKNMADARRGEDGNDSYEELKRKLEWLNRTDEQNRLYYTQEYEDENERPEWNFAVEENSLQDYLMSQLIMELHSQQEKDCMEFILASLDSKGYLREDPDWLAGELKISREELDGYLSLIREAEPAGVGASGPEECLVIQMERMAKHGLITEKELETGTVLIRQYLELLGKKRFTQIAGLMDVGTEEILSLYDLIQKLNPVPGNSFSSREKLRYIRPDVTVVKFESYFEILINDMNTPNIAVNSYYLNLLKQDGSEEVQEYIKSKARQAQWICRCVEERNHTLSRVARAIVEIQHSFFEQPDGRRVAMNLQDVAGRLGLHESTVSRAVRNKFLQCSRGVFPMNYFFVKGLSGDSGEKVTPEMIKQQIKAAVESEKPEKPLSDQKIADLLNGRGIPVSRRTIAKYRAELMIPDTAGRRRPPER